MGRPDRSCKSTYELQAAGGRLDANVAADVAADVASDTYPWIISSWCTVLSYRYGVVWCGVVDMIALHCTVLRQVRSGEVRCMMTM